MEEEGQSIPRVPVKKMNKSSAHARSENEAEAPHTDSPEEEKALNTIGEELQPEIESEGEETLEAYKKARMGKSWVKGKERRILKDTQ